MEKMFMEIVNDDCDVMNVLRLFQKSHVKYIQ